MRPFMPSTIWAPDCRPRIEGMDCTMRATAERVLQFADALGIRRFRPAGYLPWRRRRHYGGGDLCESKEMRSTPAAADSGCARQSLVSTWQSGSRRLWAVPLASVLFRNTFERWRSSITSGCAACSETDRKSRPIRSKAIAYPCSRITPCVMARASSRIGRPTSRNSKMRSPRFAIIRLCSSGERKTAPLISASAEPLRRNFRDGRLVAFEGVGHLPYEEAPEDFNRALIDFRDWLSVPGSVSEKPSSLRTEQLRTSNSSIHAPHDLRSVCANSSPTTAIGL